ncbi:hypothetical protein LDENG_00220990 [Lucifuga dentata]|nr:hypothetical protein LDENG_00220990 [Lucifuga dentata]
MQSGECPGKDLGRALCIVTGASKGFGRTLSKEISRLVKPGSVVVLVARSGDELRALQAELTESEAGRGGVQAQAVVADLAEMEGVDRVISACKDAAEDIQHVLLINNAGSIGDVWRYFKSFTNMAEVNSYLSFNVSSPLCLTAAVLQTFPQRPGRRRTVVNVSSLSALQPFSCWTLYCTGKAARDMMFRVLAKEEPDVRVLNYAPGPLDTDMYAEARTKTANPDMRKRFSDMFAEGQVLTCETSCAKLMKVLLQDSFTSGAHLDFYDL